MGRRIYFAGNHQAFHPALIIMNGDGLGKPAFRGRIKAHFHPAAFPRPDRRLIPFGAGTAAGSLDVLDQQGEAAGIPDLEIVGNRPSLRDLAKIMLLFFQRQNIPVCRRSGSLLRITR